MNSELFNIIMASLLSQSLKYSLNTSFISTLRVIQKNISVRWPTKFSPLILDKSLSLLWSMKTCLFCIWKVYSSISIPLPSCGCWILELWVSESFVLFPLCFPDTIIWAIFSSNSLFYLSISVSLSKVTIIN